MNLRIMAGCAAILLVIAPAASRGQTLAEFRTALSGEWQIVDPIHAASGKSCRMTLSEQATSVERLALSHKDCSTDLTKLTGWNIIDGQVLLFAGEEALAALGGNQRRLSGNTAKNQPIILDRLGPDPVRDQLAAARQASGCHYLGFSSTCATDAALEKPAQTGDAPISINVLVNLNARAEARDDAEVLGVVPQNTCIEANVCAAAADGVWCRATFGEKEGWLKQIALRQQKWPVVTFVSQCAANSILTQAAPPPTN